MKSTKELIEEYLQQPLKIGDSVRLFDNEYSSDYTTIKDINFNKIKHEWYKVLNVFEDFITIESKYNTKDIIRVNKEFVAEKYTGNIGVNPFPKKSWQSEIRFSTRDLEGVLFTIGYDRHSFKRNYEVFNGVDVYEVNWNPYFLKENGEKIYYQRDFCWTLNDKHLLIESIINGIEIGKIVLRKRSFEWVEKQIKNGNLEVSFKDVVDGKQRLNALLGFLNNEFCDIRGNYWEDYSQQAKHSFLSFMGITFGEMGENATDEDVKATFLGVNFTGVPMSQDHIEFVKNISL